MKVDQCNKKRLFCFVRSFFRRTLSALMILALLPMCLSMPVMAANYGSSQWINILDYGFANSGTSNKVYLSPSSSETTTTVSFDIPGSSKLYYVDMIIQTDDESIEVYRDYPSNPLSVFQISPGVYRIYGWMNTFGNILSFVFEHTNGYYINFISVRASVVNLEVLPEDVSVEASGYVHGLPGKVLSFSYPDNSYSSWTYDSFEEFDGNSTNGSFKFNYIFPDWKKYDCLDLQLSFIVDDVTSVTGFFGNQTLDIEVSPFVGDSQNSWYYVFVSIDLSGLDRSSSELPTIVVTGNAGYQLTNQASILDACGYVVVEQPSLWSYWFTNISSWLSSGFSSVTSSISTFSANVGNSISIQTSSLSSSINTWITEQTSSITGWISTVNTNVGSWIGSHTNSIVYQFDKWGQGLVVWMGDYTNSIISSINSGVNSIVSAITGGDQADDLQQGADQIGEAGSSLGSNIGSIQDFEDQYFGQLDTNMGTIISGGNISGIVAPLAFVQRYTNMIVAGIPSNFLVIFTLPILLGIFMFMVNHRIKVPRPDRSSDYVTHDVGGHKNDGNS